MKVLILNGSLGGAHKNSAEILKLLNGYISENQTLKIQSQVLHLSENPERDQLEKALLWAEAFVFVTGTYWDSWGSPLQKFLEQSTEWEGQKHFFAKPAAVVVSMHSVGGKGVLSRLQGVLVTFGCLIPPMSGMVISLASELALSTPSVHAEDFWQVHDLKILIHNLTEAWMAYQNQNYKSWEIDRTHYLETWVSSQKEV